MKRLAIVLVGAFVAIVGARAWGEEPVPARTRIGVVDIGLVFQSSHRRDALAKALNAEKDRLEVEWRTKFDQPIEQKRRELDKTPSLDARKELKALVAKSNQAIDVMRESLQLKQEDLTLEILTDINKAVLEVAKERRLDLVLKTDSIGWGDERFRERIFRAQVDAVLYVDPKLDLTDAVLARLDKPR